MTTLLADTGQLLTAAGDIRSAVAGSDLDHHVTAYRVGNIVGWRQLFAFTTAVSDFAEASAAQLKVIANAIALGADDVERADRIDVEAGDGAGWVDASAADGAGWATGREGTD